MLGKNCLMVAGETGHQTRKILSLHPRYIHRRQRHSSSILTSLSPPFHTQSLDEGKSLTLITPGKMDPSRHLLLYADGNSIAIDGSNTTFDGNFTIDCIADCIGVCIYNVCLPSPPLSPASLPFEDGSKSTPVSRDHLLPTLIITATSAVVGSFILLMSLYFYLRFRHRRRRRRFSPAAAAEDSVINGDDDLVPGGEIEHHIWYIRTQGLDESTISSIASWVYKSGDGFVDGKDCSVCLGEFIDGEHVRLLPKCSHAFHLPCIDMWLRSHVNCPLCRAPIVPPASVPSPASMAVNTDQAEPEAGSSVESIEALPWESNIDGTEIRIVIHESSSSSSELQLISSPKEEDELQPIRRSVSLDSFSLDALSREGSNEGEVLQEEEEGHVSSANREKPVKGTFRLKGCTKMERSLSSQSARWFFPSRYGLPRNSILPM